MRTRSALLSLSILSLALTAAGTAAAADAASRDRDDPTVSADFGGGLGLDIPTGGLGVGPGFFIEGGPRFRLGPGSLVTMLRIGFQTFSTTAEGAAPCPSDTGCMATDGGQFTADVNEQALSFGLPITYRFFPPDEELNPYAGVAPTLFLVKASSTMLDSENTETGTQFGVALILGGQLRLGPGALFLELGYQYAGLSHRITGDGNLGAVTTALGYRVML